MGELVSTRPRLLRDDTRVSREVTPEDRDREQPQKETQLFLFEKINSKFFMELKCLRTESM